MKKAIKDHAGDFAAILALVLLAAGVGGYILSNQRLRFPLIEEKPYVVNVELEDAQAVQPGQGQTVRTAGVEIGQIGKVKLQGGKAKVAMELKPKYKGYIKQNATALLRSKTGLKDMFIEVDPGTGKAIPNNGTISASNTAPDIDPDEILSALDSDTRSYLQLLITGAGEGLKGHGNDLRETMARLGPTNRDLRRLNSAVATRKVNLKRLINRYGKLTQELGGNDRNIVRFVRSSNDALGALADENQNISSSVSKLPRALRTTSATLSKVDTFSSRLRPTLQSLRPAVRALNPANKAVLPLVREATPEVRDQIRPFTRIAPANLRNLGSAATNVTKASPDLTLSLNKLNRFFNIGAYNPGGAQGLTGNPTVDRNRNEGYLYWLAWNGVTGNSLFSTADASGPLRRITLGGVNCATLKASVGLALSGQGLPSTVTDTLTPTVNNTITTLGSLGVCTP